jgi:hypothetical protein
MKSKHLQIILTLLLLVGVVSAFATTWSKTSAPLSPLSLGMSADGKIILALPSTTKPVISTNWGQTWANVTNSPPWGAVRQRGVAVSADGTTIIATLSSNTTAQSWVFITTNYGGNWTRTTVLSSNNFGLTVACSEDALNIIAGIANGPICFSTNAGANWNTSSVPHADWVSVASSASGQRMAAVVNGGNLYFSTDFGATWTPTNLPAQSWNSVCLSSDGNWVGATSTFHTYISSNAGANWITNNLNGQAIACSANGSNWVIAGAQVYTSNDGGVTWSTNLSTAQWFDAAVSADGCEFMVAGDGGVWAGRTTPSPQLNIHSAGGNVALSWLVPSTNFVLQQNSDLASADWVSVSNSPVLNFTNLQNQVSLSTSPGNTFFRLIAQ